MKAADEVGAHPGWTVMVRNLAETPPTFIAPVRMPPLPGVLGLESRDLIGYTAMRFFIHRPVMPLPAA